MFFLKTFYCNYGPRIIIPRSNGNLMLDWFIFSKFWFIYAFTRKQGLGEVSLYRLETPARIIFFTTPHGIKTLHPSSSIDMGRPVCPTHKPTHGPWIGLPVEMDLNLKPDWVKLVLPSTADMQ